MGATAGTLTSLEVAVGRRRAALTWCELVRVHAQAHRATGTAPFSTRGGEDLVQTLGLRLRADGHRPWDDEHPDTVGDATALHHLRGSAEVFEPTVGAGADEHGVDAHVAQRCAGSE